MKNEDAVLRLLDLPRTRALMAVVAVGHPCRPEPELNRETCAEVLLKEF